MRDLAKCFFFYFQLFFFSFLLDSLGPPPMNMYVILMYVFKNANTNYDLDVVRPSKQSKTKRNAIPSFSLHVFASSSINFTQFRAFIKENISERSRILTQAVESVQTNINWMDKNYATIVDWLNNEMRT